MRISIIRLHLEQSTGSDIDEGRHFSSTEFSSSPNVDGKNSPALNEVRI